MSRNGTNPTAAPAPPGVSIVTATFNRSRVLRHTIASVVGQRFQNWELLVIGDACTDDTAAVVAGFGDPRIRFHNLEVNVGEQSGPNNAGMSMARGALIAFLNHDDLWFPDHLQTLVTAIEETGADLVFSLLAMMIPGHPPILSNFSPSGCYEPRVSVPASSWLFRRELFERVGPWRSYRLSYQPPSQDWLFRALRAGSDLRLVPSLTVVTFPSGSRKNSYVDPDDAENARYAALVGSDPAFREQLLTEIVLGQVAGDPLALSRTAVGSYVSRAAKNAINAALSRLGVSPASIRLFLESPRRGHFINTLRRTRGLPELSRERRR